MRETPQALAAFHEYCVLGPERSLRTLAERNQKYSKSRALLMKWSAGHQWQERVKLYDAERMEERRKKREAELDKMNERHALIGTSQQARALKQIEALIDAQSFTAAASVQLLKYATDLERVARGTTTEQIALEIHHDDADDLSDEDVQAILAMAKLLKDRKGAHDTTAG